MNQDLVFLISVQGKKEKQIYHLSSLQVLFCDFNVFTNYLKIKTFHIY